MSFFLALDAGGTKTDYVLADESRELARVRTATIKRMRVDAATASRNLESALAQLDGRLRGLDYAHLHRDCRGERFAGERLVASIVSCKSRRRLAHSD
jgi:glucosamine kinase